MWSVLEIAFLTTMKIAKWYAIEQFAECAIEVVKSAFDD